MQESVGSSFLKLFADIQVRVTPLKVDKQTELDLNLPVKPAGGPAVSSSCFTNLNLAMGSFENLTSTCSICLVTRDYDIS